MSVPAAKVLNGPVFVLGDNVDTDQIIPARYLNLVPTIPEEYEKLGSHCLSGLPAGLGDFIAEGERKTRYPIIIAGENFGCGSSREHAPIALGAAGVKAIVAASYARIFFRNVVATGELYPLESTQRLVERFQTGDEVKLSVERLQLENLRTGETFELKPLGEALPVIEAGGLFAYARKTGMIPAAKRRSS